MMSLKLKYIYEFFDNLENEPYTSRTLRLKGYINYHRDIRNLQFEQLEDLKKCLSYKKL